ncbi:BLUF domain-containing protein [Caulobacter hibisci]|uniref:BLUF domain-containing protein n=1 Tax=Caulobacter hibisci TaxID=2035993 RepID=A0ABS0T3Y5_9CAUL|nr:BLUF domain-containing protein [Caulobacter hibisci]MBI1686597.1 BLUF domain-containing protein [Caulobacter hibisci]
MTDPLARRGLYRLIYASRATDPAGLDEDLPAIVAKSIQNNRIDDITGFLAAGEGRFLQVLEGPGQVVAEVYERIGRDPRHDEIVLIADGLAERRLFRDWNMGQRRLEAEDASALAEVGLEHFTPAGLDEERALRLLITLGARHLR